MKISILCPPEIPIPLDGYGGIERECQDLLHELVFERDGYEADMFCTPGPNAASVLRPYPKNAMDLDWGQDLVLDFTHQKLGRLTFEKSRYIAMCYLTDALSGVNDAFGSRAVARGHGQPGGKVIYGGLQDHYKISDRAGGYVMFLGKFSVIKRPDIAVMAARRARVPIVLAGTAGKWSGNEEWAKGIVAMHDGKDVVVRADVTEAEKVELLSHASALLAPSDWSPLGTVESLGLVAVEGLLSGVPVITSGDGGLSEIVTPEAGAICRTLDEYVDALKHSGEFTPEACHARGSYFTPGRVLDDFVKHWKESR